LQQRFGAPYLAGKGILSALGTKALGQGVSAGLINLGTQAALGKELIRLFQLHLWIDCWWWRIFK
jgi:hypothetical protein